MEPIDLIAQKKELFRFASGIVFPTMFDISTVPEGAVVSFAEKGGVYYQIQDLAFQDSPLIEMNELYKKFHSRRYYYKDSGSRALRLELSRCPDINWRPSFHESPFSSEDEAKNVFFHLLRDKKLKIQPHGLLYTAMVNTTYQKTPPILKAAFCALVGLEKYKRRK